MGIRIGIGSLKIGQGSTGVDWSSYCTPQNVAAAVASDTSIGVTWDAVANATSYKIYYCTDGVTFGDSITSLTNNGTLTGLTADTIYFIRVASLKGAEECDPSAMVMERTDIAAIVGAYYVSPTGSGSTYSYDVPGNFNDAIAAANHENDVIVFKRGTYTYSNGAQLDYKGVAANGVTIRGINRDYSKVVLDFNSSGDAGGWLYVQRTLFTLRDITIKDCVSSNTLYLLGASSGIIEHCRFRNASAKHISIVGDASQGKWIIRRNIFEGVANGTFGAGGCSMNITGTALVEVDVEYNVFMPTSTHYSQGVWIAGTPSAARTINFLNNEFYACEGNAIYVNSHNFTGNILNNIFAIRRQAVSGNCNGYASTTDYNLNLGSEQTPAYYDSDITPGAHEVDGDYRLKITKFPLKSWLMFTFDDISGIGTTGWNRAITLHDAKGWHMTSVVNVREFDEVYGGTAPQSNLRDYINGGHDVGVHSFSHTPITVIAGAISIAYSGGGTKSVVIATDVVGGGADWKGIIKDYTQWTGSLTLDAGGAGEDVFSFYEGGVFKTLADLETWIETHENWSATTQIGDATHVSKNTLCIALANVTEDVSTGTAFNMEETPYLWIETKFAKDRLESILTTLIGESYTVKSWGSPFNLMSLNAMDAIMEAGYGAARGINTLISGSPNAQRSSLLLAKYNIAVDSLWIDGDDAAAVLSETGTALMLLSFASGLVGCSALHSASMDHDSEYAAYEDVFDILEECEDMGLNIVSMREFAEYVNDNSTVISGTVGNDLRVRLDQVEQFDGTKTTGSVAIDAGVDVSITEDIEYVAIVVPPNIGAFES